VQKFPHLRSQSIDLDPHLAGGNTATVAEAQGEEKVLQWTQWSGGDFVMMAMNISEVADGFQVDRLEVAQARNRLR